MLEENSPLLVKDFNSIDQPLILLVKGIQTVLEQSWPSRITEKEMVESLKRMGAYLSGTINYKVTLPLKVAKYLGYTYGVIDIHATFNQKHLGVEVSRHQWYGKCIPELLKLSWAELDYRIIAWTARRIETVEKLEQVELPKLPQPVLVITHNTIKEISN